MDIRPLTENFAVSPQVDIEHMKEIAGSGFRSVICNRPDGEDVDQPDFLAVEYAAQANGLEIRWIPVAGGAFSEGALSEFRAALDEMPKPILA
ncbi:MAG: sulfur transferase domain-containing protein, partial [Pseudomonadota bacterium]